MDKLKFLSNGKVLIALLLAHCCVHVSAQINVTSNAQFYQENNMESRVRQAFIVFPVDVLFGKYGFHYEIQTKKIVHLDLEVGFLGDNYEGDMFFFPIETLDCHRNNNTRGYYFSIAALIDRPGQVISDYLGMGIMYGYRYYASEEGQWTQTNILALILKYQEPFSKHLFFQFNISLGGESVKQLCEHMAGSRYQLKLRKYFPINAGFGVNF